MWTEGARHYLCKWDRSPAVGGMKDRCQVSFFTELLSSCSPVHDPGSTANELQERRDEGRK